MEAKSNKPPWDIQVHALRKGRFTFVAQKANGFRVEFKPFATRSEAASRGKELLTKIETEKQNERPANTI